MRYGSEKKERLKGESQLFSYERASKLEDVWETDLTKREVKISAAEVEIFQLLIFSMGPKMLDLTILTMQYDSIFC